MSCATGVCKSAPGEVGMGCSSPVEVESSPLRLRVGDDLASALRACDTQNRKRWSSIPIVHHPGFVFLFGRFDSVLNKYKSNKTDANEDRHV